MYHPYGLDEKFHKLIIKLQEINKKNSCQLKTIDKIGKIIKDGDLLNKCTNKDFAKQLLLKNDVPEKYWNPKS